MRSQWRLGLAVLFTLSSRAKGFYIPLEVEQMPTITAQTPSPITAFPFDDSFSMRCEAKGNPPPAYRWTKDGEDFDPQLNSLIKTEQNNGTFILHTKYLSKFRGKYRCYASNKMGTAITEEIVLIVPNVPKFPKEKIPPIVVEEGQPVVLSCNPPEGMPPRQIYWMSVGLQHIDQDERVSMGKDGNLYFSNALQKDNRKDYCCFAAFSAIRTIVQKTAIPVEVNNNSIVVPERQPSLLLPSGVQSEVILVKGQELELECIAQGFPTPVIEWIKMGEKLPQRTNIKNFGKLLTITNIEEVDAGKYLCKARNSAGDAVHYYDVIVEEPPKWLLEPPKSQLAVVGEDVHIKCSVTGMPQPDIVWRRNGKTLDDDLSSQRKVFDDTLILHNAKPEDSAVYQCEASNRHGTILANANIMITNMAPLMLTMDYQEYAVVQGGDIVMDCRVFSSPPPSISWNKGEDGAIIERERFSVLENGSLKAFKAKKEDSGEYICFASNAEGKSTITAVLNVKDPTRIVEPPQNLRILRGTTAQLNCLAEFDKSLSKDFVLQWTRDGEEISPNFTAHSRYVADKGTLQIINVTQSDQGVYTCIARTRLDQDAAVAVVTVLDVPDAPEDLELYDRKGRSVSLSWIPQSDHNNSVTEFLVEYKESQWDPENWHELQRVPGNKVTADLLLQGHLDYQFRVSAVNAIGRGPPSQPTERFQTNATVPDRNPDDIRIRGHLPHQMDISWEPLLPVEHNGPGLEYKLSYRRLGVEDVWKEHLVKRHSFVVKDTPTFVPYEIKVQSRNSHGWGPEPKTVTGYSGEDLPLAAPRDVGVEVINTTLLRVNWTMVPPSTVRGHLGGYNVHWLRTRSLLRTNQIPDERYSLAFPGNRTHVLVPDLKPFSEYRLTVNVYNKKGNGPSCDPVVFHTPEGVPEQVPILTASNAQEDSITLVWGPPFEANGILSGYLLQYQNVNSLDMNELIEVNISGADTTQWLLQGLEEGSLYRFQLSACTQVGCGLPRAQESSTLAQAGAAGLKENFSSQGWFIGIMCAVALLTLTVLIACFVRRKKGGKYAVKEKEELHPEVDSQGMNDDAFSEYRDEKLLQGSQCSLDRNFGGSNISQDSLVDYAEGGIQFNEDGSFIGEYSVH